MIVEHFLFVELFYVQNNTKIIYGFYIFLTFKLNKFVDSSYVEFTFCSYFDLNFLSNATNTLK